MKSYSSKEVISILKQYGWYHVTTQGSHYQFKHPTIKGKATVKHPCKDIPERTLKSISAQTGINFR